MFLRRVTITGFKSFATKTVLDLDHGITGVVGPNGSGKSNLADAIRWALGEQGKGRLRLSERDEVVFAGTDQRARASFAEVVLLFDNEGGAFPLDLTEVEISRRLYRSGEADYRLAGKSVRLSDIQALLAQAGVGAGTYAVIGQGMIDSILMSSPAERKALFDEAAGIRGPELGREAALRKLTATAANLTRLRDLSAELAPRLTALSSAVAAEDEQRQLEVRIKELRAAVVAAEHAHWADAHDQATERLAAIARTGHQLSHSLRHLDQDRTRREHLEAKALQRREQLAAELTGLEHSRDQAATELADRRTAVAEANRLVQAAKRLAAQLETANTELTTATTVERDMRAELAANAEGFVRASKAVDRSSREVAAAQAALVAIRNGTGDGARDQYLDHALQLLKTLAIGLGTPELTTDQIRLIVHKAGRLLSHATRSGAAELLAELKAAQKHLESAMTKRETAVEHQTNISITGRSLEIDLAHQEGEVKRLITARDQIAAEIVSLADADAHLTELQAAESQAAAALRTFTTQLEAQRAELAKLNSTTGPGASSSLIARLERTKAAQKALHIEAVAARTELAAAKTGLAAAATRAAGWDIKPTTSSNHQNVAALTDQLTRAEALLEAKIQSRHDQIEQYHEATERSTELAAQITDLETAEADLRQLVSELDTLIRARFKENFQALAEQFSTYFGRLFEGGTASLDLTEAEDGTYGVNIKASPKGKRLSSIAALSGGERALAGVALVAAIMRVNPSPFVVLDEVDAALDEANSGRLAAILTELQEYSQLIVITHNRQTMKSAKVLFGVTMNEHHASHLISMRLEQATALAAR